MNRFYISGLTIFLLTINNVAIAATSAVKSGQVEAYPPEFVKDYAQECIQTSVGEGLSEPEAKNLCQCTIRQFQQQYTLKEFKELTAAAETDDTANNSLIEVGQICFENILYEQ